MIDQKNNRRTMPVSQIKGHAQFYRLVISATIQFDL
jgi:hypothetical protein